MLKTILAAVDGSPRTSSVVATALDIAERFDGRVHLFRAAPLPPEFPAAAAGHADELALVMDAEVRDFLADLARGSPRFVVAEPDLVTPQPWQAILDAAARIGADLIVLGSHGYGGWDRLLGTTASRVTDHADRDVLVVHARPAARDDARAV